MADVFVSYARVDKHRVLPLVAALENQRWSVWWDPEIVPGQEFDELVSRELGRASAVLVVWTKDSVQSRWVRGEAREGADRGVLVPVRFDNAILPIDFRALHTIDLNDGSDLGRSPVFDAVIRAVSGLIAGPAVPGATPAITVAAMASAADVPVRVSICVLPFANVGGDSEQEFFADGLTGDVITELARWRMLSVRPLSAVSRYRAGNTDAMRVAQELKVRYVVEGSVRRLGDRVRISVQLIDAETGEQLWADRFDRVQTEIFAVQDEVVRRIVGTLVGRVQTVLAERARRKPSASLAAYECVQRGNALPWDDPQAAAEATRLFEQAIALDPGYAIAHALLGTMRIGQWRNAPAGSDADIEEAYARCKRAVELDDSDSTCHSLLAHACLYRRLFELALMHMRRSVEINPNNAWNRADMGVVLTYTGPAEQAVDWLKSAREIDPYFDPPWYWRQWGQACMVLRRFEEALAMFELIPLRTLRASAYLAACRARLGGPEDARPYVAECLAGNPEFSVRHFMSKEPFRHAEDAAFLGESLRLAGLPE
ncbi:MAG TPA: TIR domain-containing protein [Steroidobacteraceae bacterium]|nr:TIR domain-containing protein [Steroidobacteraceae bacterium]